MYRIGLLLENVSKFQALIALLSRSVVQYIAYSAENEIDIHSCGRAPEFGDI